MGAIKRYLIFILSLAFISMNNHAWANNGTQYSFIRVDASNGLINNQVTCIFKDSRGFVWIGTSSGLSRYDGVNFVNYKHDDSDPNSILDNFIEKIQEDKDGNLWIKTRWYYTIFNFDKNIFINNIADTLKQKGINGNVDDIFIDNDKRKWFKSQANGRYHFFDYEKKKLVDPFISSKYYKNTIKNFLHVGQFYYCLYDNGAIECFNQDSYQLEFSDSYLFQFVDENNFSGLFFVDKEGDIWASTNNDGIFHFQLSSKKWSHYTTESTDIKLSSNLITRIVQDDKGLIWIGTNHGGVDVVNKFSKHVKTLYHQKEDNKSLSQNSITDIFVDNNDVVWVGTYKRGICYYHESIHKFSHYHGIVSDENSLPYNDVNCFAEDKKGNLWIGTNGGGLIYFNRKNYTYKVYKHQPQNPNSLSNNVVVSVFIDNEGLLWVGTFTGGINVFDGKWFKRYRASKETGLPNDNIWTITQDKFKRIWIGTLGSGIILYDKVKKSFLPVPNNGSIQFYSSFVTQIRKMSNGNMFIATGNGIYFYNIDESRYKYHPTENMEQNIRISNDNVNDVFEDSRGLFWVATREGLTMIDPYSGYKKIFRKEDGLSRDIINCILEDEYQSIWVSKSTGVSQIVVNPLKPGEEYNFSIYHYTKADGLQGQEFNVNASYKTSKGELIFGGPNGFNLFKTKDIKYNKNLPKVVFTDFQIFNKSVKVGEEINDCIVLDESIVTEKDVVIRHSMNVFSIEFAALNSFISEKVRYKYMLEGFDNEWREIDGQNPKASYTNLDAGNYLFKVKACNNDGLWNDEPSILKIKVLPPFYATPWAFAIYIAFFLGLLIYFRQSMLKKARFKFEMEQERLLAKRNHEMDEMKLRFLTNVSHEFRTPLTLILTPLDKLRKKETEGSKTKLIDTIERNARNLLDLVNQLLDFRKLDLHGLKYNPSYGDIVSFLDEVCENFKDSFEKKGVNFEYKSKLQELFFEFDNKKLQKVMMNLISNALKFTPPGGNVKVAVKKVSTGNSNENVIIKVKDSGIGVNNEEKDKIFERFYQSKNNISMGVSGSGIGLNLAKEMVILHGGTIEVESEPGKGAEFIITLPVVSANQTEKDAAVEKPIAKIPEQITSNKQTDKQKSTILLIEDNFDFRSFMKESLEENYIVHEAPDGVEGFDIIHKVIPDLIISDVMMPRMDGMELCHKLKSDIRTSHIPLILLTARTADEDKIKGLEIGADDYITKPFNMDLLLLRVQNLMEKQKKIQNQFKKNIKIEASEVEIPSAEEKLIKKAIAYVEKHIDEPKFSVEDLSAELGMSRVYLYKKLLAITGKTPVEFIRVIRLKRGAQLLEKSTLNVAEVAYAVGFNSPRYFSKYFKEEYGMLPKAYIKMYGKQTDDKIDIN